MGSGLELFAQRFPALAPRVAAVAAGSRPLESWRDRSVSADSLLERWLSGLELKEDMAIALSGVGDGSHVAFLLERLPPGCAVFCGEPEVSRFKRFLNTDGAASILSDARVFVGVGEMDHSFFASMALFPVLEVRDAQPLIFAPLFNEQEAYYSELFLQFARQLDYWRKLFGTNVVSSGLWQRNTLRNLETLLPAPDLSALSGAFAGVPMVVASAGPSLDESLDFIRWAQRRAVVVAVNSSFQALRNAGIDPHFVLAADPNESTDRGFAKADLGRALLVCPFLVYPKVATRFAGRAITWSASSELVSFLRQRLGQEPGALVAEQGTVSACAFDLARIFGCPTVYFAGQDLAARADGQTHASDSFYTDQGANRTNVDKCRWLPGNTLETVPVEEKLYVYLKTFEEMARRHGGSLKLVNLSRLGARIEGVPYRELKKARGALSSVSASKVEKGWKRARAQCGRTWLSWEQARGELQGLRDYAQAVCSLALRGALRLETQAAFTEEERRRAEQTREELERLLQSDARYRVLLEGGQLKRELLDYRRQRRALERDATAENADCEILKAYFWALAEGAYHLLAGLEPLCGEAVPQTET